MTPEEINASDRNFLRAQELARMNERTSAIWPIFLSMASGFGIIAAQGGDVVYLVGLFPILIYFLSLHIRNGEDTLKQIRKYLYQQEKDSPCGGYETWTHLPAQYRNSHGGYKRAIREGFGSTQVIAFLVLTYHLAINHLFIPLIVVVGIIEGYAIVKTWRNLL